MNVAVAGCGWLGARVGAVLAARGDRVYGIRRDPRSAAALAGLGIEPWPLDLSEPGAAARLPADLDALVASQAATGSDAAAYRRAYVEINRALVAEAALRGVSRYVYTGSTGVFGQSAGEIVDEVTEPVPGDEHGAILLEAEAVVRERGMVVRLSGLYGPERWGAVERVRSGMLALGAGDDAWMNWCRREDAAAYVVAALDRGRPGAVYHGSDAAPVPRAEFVRWVAGRLGIAPPSTTAAPPPGRPNRRVLAQRTRDDLGVALLYPTYREGFAEAFDRAA